MTIILITLSLLLDGILPLYINNTSYLIPLLTVTTLFIIYPLYKNKSNNYLITTIFIGILYDLLYTNLLFFHGIIFLTLGIIVKYIYKNYKQTFIRNIIYIVLLITTYELLTSLILFILRIVPVTISKITYKITHSLLINVIYAETLYLVLLKRKKYNHK